MSDEPRTVSTVDQVCQECGAPATSSYVLNPNANAAAPIYFPWPVRGTTWGVVQYFCIRHSPMTRHAYELGFEDGRRAAAAHPQEGERLT